MINPFTHYFSIRDKDTGFYYANNIFYSSLEFKEKEFSLQASIKGKNNIIKNHIIYNLKDVINFHGIPSEGSKANFQGLIGERVLSAVLEELIDKTIHEISIKYPNLESETEGAVLREKQAYEGKGFVATYNTHFLLKHKGKTNFVILKKTPDNTPSSWYQQEKSGLQASEIDGLAYLHSNSEMYLLIGESKMVSHWYKNDYEEFTNNLTDRIVKPFQALFPSHELIFVFMGKENVLFENNGPKLCHKPEKLAGLLGENQVNTIFIPLPPMPRSIEEYASELHASLPFTREIIKEIEKMI